MSTANFYTQKDFDLFVCDDEQAEFLDLDFSLDETKKELGKEPQFFDFSLRPGYYEGAQIFTEENYYCRTYGNPHELENEDCKMQWDMCRSKAIRMYEAEKKWINREFLPCLAKHLGMRKLICIGRFSNGEAIYEWAK